MLSIKKKQTKKRVKIPALSDDLLEKWKQQRSIVFLLQYQDHYVVVRTEIGQDFWMAKVIRDDVYDALDMDMWKESVHFIAKKFGISNSEIELTKRAFRLVESSIM